MMSRATVTRRRFLVPEVVQTSALDCGPATLKCLIEGFGIPVSYGRLREACQTDVDGTSINTVEEVAVQVGLEAKQIMLPSDHVLLPEARALPAIIVARQPNGENHFIVAWWSYGRLVQVMDPAKGRRWMSREQFVKELYEHVLPVPAQAWRRWAASAEFVGALRRRLGNIGLSERRASGLIDGALSDMGWHSVAVLDAATRMIASMVGCGAIGRGRQASDVLGAFCRRAGKKGADAERLIPETYWSVQPGADGAGGEKSLLMRGAVLVRVRGNRAVPDRAGDARSEGEDKDDSARSLPELATAISESPSRPWRELLRLLRADGLLAPAVLVAALALATGGVVLEALLFRGLLDLSGSLGFGAQRLGGIAALIAFVCLLMFVELPLVSGAMRAGRRLETRLRLEFLRKIPRLSDRYFHSRLTSDMAERSHCVDMLRSLPDLGRELLRSVFGLAATMGGIIWLDPGAAGVAIATATISTLLPLVVQPCLAEREMRVRTHGGALSRFYLDGLLGFAAIRTHGGERAVRSEHESLLTEWVRAGLGLQRAVVGIDGLVAFVGFALAALLVFGHVQRGGEAGSVLLLVYWALRLPALGQEVALAARRYPSQRNITLRLLEPLGAPEEGGGAQVDQAESGVLDEPLPEGQFEPGVSIVFEEVSVRAAGHTIIEGINVSIPAGSHVAILGASGAGKSTLVGTLLGWHRAATGRICVDGEPLVEGRIPWLRRRTAWVDPAVQIWNRSMVENLHYGVRPDAMVPMSRVIDQANLRPVLDTLPDGLQTSLGEGGALVSGGEGQRVRLGRGMLRPGVRLVILDEPFRGLDRAQRRELLARARRWWRGVTLICITHDAGETRGFDRVLVMGGGRIAEEGTPEGLAQQAGSCYRSMLEAEAAVREGIWSRAGWRRWTLEHGAVSEDEGEAVS